MSEITQFQRNHVSVLLSSKLIQHTKITHFYKSIFSTILLFNSSVQLNLQRQFP